MWAIRFFPQMIICLQNMGRRAGWHKQWLLLYSHGAYGNYSIWTQFCTQKHFCTKKQNSPHHSYAETPEGKLLMIQILISSDAIGTFLRLKCGPPAPPPFVWSNGNMTASTFLRFIGAYLGQRCCKFEPVPLEMAVTPATGVNKTTPSWINLAIK